LKKLKKMSSKHVLKICNDIFGESTIHGIPRVIKSNSLLSKLIWALCFIISAGYCFYIITTGIVDFLNYDTIVDIAYSSEIPSALPTITICNSNQFQTNSSFQFANQKQYKIIDNFEAFVKNTILINDMSELNDTFKQSFLHHLNETLISCRFNNENCLQDIDTDFKRVFVPLSGNCFSFSYDSKNPKLSSRIGRGNGFSIELFIGDPRLIPNYIKMTGYRVFISI